MSKNKEFDGIFKPYLIHVEFEVLNILTQIKINKPLKEAITDKGYRLDTLENTIGLFLSRIRQLIAIMNY